MDSSQNWFFKLTLAALVLTILVMMTGSYTRHKDAGLGCPDWPGCYGQLFAPRFNKDSSAKPQNDGIKVLGNKDIKAPQNDVTRDPIKAWIEMGHRYAAGILGLLIISIGISSFWRFKQFPALRLLAPLLLLILLFQILLGRWTITLKLLPAVVMLHLIGANGLVMVLTLILLSVTNISPQQNNSNLRYWTLLGIFLIVFQIILGGLTSANYASLVCLDFPACQGELFPSFDFDSILQLTLHPLTQPLGLSKLAKISLQQWHRWGAFVNFVYWMTLMLISGLKERDRWLQRLALVIISLLCVQISLGLANIFLLLPLPVAIAHNGVAALLLVSVITFNYRIWAGYRSVEYNLCRLG